MGKTPDDEHDEHHEHHGAAPSKSHLKRVQLALQQLGKQMTTFNDDQLERMNLPEDVVREIKEYRRMKSFGAQRRQLQLIGKVMRDLDPKAVEEAMARVTGESKVAVALLHRCEGLRARFLESDEHVKRFIDQYPNVDIPRLRTLVRGARKERADGKPPKHARELYRYLYAFLDEPLDLYRHEEADSSKDSFD